MTVGWGQSNRVKGQKGLLSGEGEVSLLALSGARAASENTRSRTRAHTPLPRSGVTGQRVFCC